MIDPSGPARRIQPDAGFDDSPTNLLRGLGAPRPVSPAEKPALSQSGDGPEESCGDFGIRIARDGTWYYLGSPIGRKPLVKLFSTVLRREDDGSYWLVTPVERGRIEVEDAPFTAVELVVEGAGEDQILRLRTNLDEWIEAGPDHPIRVETNPATGEPSPYIVVRDRLEALILRPVFYQLVEMGVERERDGKPSLGIWSKRQFFLLGSLEG
ncbi:DUF1285 domain-containing protein [Oceanibaculum pacificum]|uniref:DUF1285 domain-containing protein n=1 Tax=Oceanibaculum pacificum TaxID=580166 RepID=UPI000A02053E|nr:DUF1285 domain-containing protein [Oceanibaculum pacificum]